MVIEKAITLPVCLPYMWWDDCGQRRDVKYIVGGQKPCEESVVHVY